MAALATASSLELRGTPGADSLDGGDGDDLLTGLAGNDTLSGGGGVDIASFAGATTGYVVTAQGGGRWTVADIDGSDGDDGTDLLTGIEKLRFADGDLQISDEGAFRINTWVRDHQHDPALAMLLDGGWIAAWTSHGQDGDGMGVYAQRFGADGQPVGAEFRLNATTADDQREVAIVALASGGFAAVWSSGEPGFALQLVGRLFAADGSAMGDEFAVDASGVGYQMQPSIAARPDGGFTVGWTGYANGISHFLARSFSSDGTPQRDPFQVDATAPPTPWGLPEVSMAPLPGGGFAAAWLTDPLDGLGERVVLRVFDATGAAVGAEVAVGDRDHGAQDDVRIARSWGGGLLAVWFAQGAQPDGAGRGIHAQRLEVTGQPAGPVFEVSAAPVGPYADTLGEPAIAALADGGFVVTWLGASQAGSHEVLARRYAADGTPAGSQFVVDTRADRQQFTPQATAQADGGFVIAWRTDSLDSPVLDLDAWGTGGVFAQRYNAAGEPMPAQRPSAGAGTRIEDRLTGAAGDDTLRGFEGDDTLQGAGGDDRLDGGAGADDARFVGPMADFVFSNTVAYRFELTDTEPANGDEGRDEAFDIERAVFVDGVLDIAQRSEFVLASVGTSDQYPGARDASIARLADGRLVAAWTGGDGSGEGVFAQLLAADATPLAPVFQVNATHWRSQASPSVAALPDGGFLVAWDSEQDGSESGIYLQRYDAVAARVGGETRVNTHTQSDQLWPQVAVRPTGEFLVVWNSLGQDGDGYGIYGQRFTAGAVPAGAEFRISQTSAKDQALPTVAVLADGSYLVAWMCDISDWPFDADVHARRLSADGTALTGEFRVNTYTTLDQGFPSVAALTGGGFVVVWHSQGQDGDGYGVYGQRFAPDGARVGDEFRVNATTAAPQSVPTVAALAGGGFVVVWSTGYYWIGDVREYDTDLRGQRFAADGSPLGDEFPVNTLDDYDQEGATIVPEPGGGFLVAWNSTTQVPVSGGGYDAYGSVLAKRFDADGVEVNELTVTGGAGSDTLRGGEGTQVLVGGTGDDTYEADLSRDRIVEWPAGGVDTLRSASTATLPGQLEHLVLIGLADIDGAGNGGANHVDGNAGANHLLGLAGDDTLVGGAGDDTLVGGTGNDLLVGGAGDDLFALASSGDGVDTLGEFVFGDRIRIDGASLQGRLATGGGATVPGGRVQLSSDGLWTTLHVGIDTFAGADVVIRIAGARGPSDFHAEGDTIRVNRAPVAAQAIDAQLATEDIAWQLPLSQAVFDDPDGDALAWTARLASGAALPSWLEFDAATRTLHGTPGNAEVGTIEVRVSARDFDGAQTSQVMSLTVLGVNDAPRLVAPLADQRALLGQAFDCQLPADAFVDIDAGDVLVHAATRTDGSPLPAWLRFDAATRTFDGTPGIGDLGAVDVRVSVRDASDAVAIDEFVLFVGAANHAPTLAHPLADQRFSGGWPMVLQLPADAFSEIDPGDRLTFAATLSGGAPLPSWLVFDAATGRFTGMSVSAIDGVFDVQVSAVDGAGASVSDVFRLTVDAELRTITGGEAADDLVDPGEGGAALEAYAGDDTLTGGSGDDTIDGGEGFDVARWSGVAADFALDLSPGRMVLVDATGAEGVDRLVDIEQLRFADRTVDVESRVPAQSYAGLPEELYHFFIVAFGAVPGVTYMDQLAEAYRWFEPLLGGKQAALLKIVEIFTTKPQYLSVYPDLNELAVRTQMVEDLVKTSASEATRQEAIADIGGALALPPELGWTLGKVIYTVFGNLGSKPLDDPTWGGTARQFANEIEVARLYTEVLHQSTPELDTLRDVIRPVTQDSDVSSDAAIVELIGSALMDG